MSDRSILEKGRASYRRREWSAAFEALSRADRAQALPEEDLERCALAAALSGRRDDFYRYLQRAYRAHVDRGDDRAAARAAFWIGFELASIGDYARGSAWLSRAERHVEAGEDCVERGYLLLPRIEQLMSRGRFDEAVAVATQARTIAERFADTDLRTFAVHAHGVALVRGGHVQDGLSLLDEALLAVTADDVAPIIAGVIYCSAISACRSVFALQRMQEWTTVLDRWCAEQEGLVMFAGECNVYRSELLQLRGEWSTALSVAEEALDLGAIKPEPRVQSLAWYQLGELKRLRGDHAAAEAAYREALRLGRDPQPGLALLWLAQDKAEAAVHALARALEESTSEQKRSRLLPSYIRAQLAFGDLDGARASCRELSVIGRKLRGAAEAATDDAAEEPEASDEAGASPALAASAEDARRNLNLLEATATECAGLSALAEGRPAEALLALRRACSAFRDLAAPYEVARVRVEIGRSCRMLGDDRTAEMELTAARATFDELGATADRRSVDELLAHPAGGDSLLTPREVQVLSLVATGMTNRSVAEELGLSVRTIDRHVSNILDKLAVSSRAAAAAKATSMGLIRAT